MPCTFSEEIIEQTISFHGHSCPGLTIGIRAAELAMRELGNPNEIEMVAVSETDMCGVDAIQFLTGCTYGKGNFLHRDFGKIAFSFFDRKTGKGLRALLNPDIRAGMDTELAALMAKQDQGSATRDELDRIVELRTLLKERFMELELEDMFDVTQLKEGLPRPAMILASLTCDCCGETVMESRTRRFSGKTVCIPCFTTMEQKI
ncbi:MULTISPECIES: FmdE family protein [unclassified Pseudodesulfovibrio]|uniref:FmdE family protein n=1 Tax=unclassified Pseudodesulfovibrio TaxID=2661612 RepID=UPI000FEB9906|nr:MULTISPECIES: FmdE family protein [unclassified Pseudodesulfovibrio]MCJ2163508.1 FmdE family protein [Pseudodesulfovibrio sp. S3-i]RWU06744.1 formylmethanofuran dehydrogenase [Pseudodesulfovibrio sp. S3]